MVDIETNPTDIKLTKKQKKALQFREAKKNKQKNLDLETKEFDDEQENFYLDVKGKKKSDKDNSEQKSTTAKNEANKSTKKNNEKNSNKKNNNNNKDSKKRKAPSSSGDNVTETSEDQHSSAKATQNNKDKKARYIVFVGSLSFNATEDDIQKHFQSCGNPTVRLRKDKATNKSKGFAFVEFDNSISLSKALHLHQSTLNNRKINVEITAGGGGASDQRKKKIADRNAKLNKEREKNERKGNQNHSKSTGGAKESLAEFQSGPGMNSERLKMLQNLDRKSKK